MVYDSDKDSFFDRADFIISGSTVTNGTAISTDLNLVFDAIHGKYFWDNGYIWDFGDGLSQVTGSTTSHLFLSSVNQPAVGTFAVKLAVYDSDDHLSMRTVQLVAISAGTVFDVAVSVVVTHETLALGQDQGVILLAHDRSRTYNYTVHTSSLPPRVYTITGLGQITNATTADPSPGNNQGTASFTLQGSVNSSFLSLPVLAGILVAVAVVAYAAIYLVRKRRAKEE